jgi:hypothetical protein
MTIASSTSAPTRSATIKVFAMNDCDWMAAATAEEASAAYSLFNHLDIPAEEMLEFPRELTDKEMDKLRFVDTEVQPEAHRTFREQLQHIIEAGETFPTFFASTEF